MTGRLGRWMGILLVLAGASLAGCGGKQMVTVSGTVLLEGQPVAEAAVMLEPASGTPVTAITDASGQFRAEAPPGSYKVAITKVKTSLRPGADPESQSADAVETEYLTPVKYASPMTSGLTLEVAPGMEPVTWDLKP